MAPRSGVRPRSTLALATSATIQRGPMSTTRGSATGGAEQLAERGRVGERREPRRRHARRDRAVGSDRQRDQPGGAFLYQRRVARHHPRLAHRVRRADRGVAGERQLGARREDPQAIARARRRQHERRLGQVGPGGDARHLRVGEPLRVEDHRDRVAGERAGGEDVDLLETDGAHAGSLAHNSGQMGFTSPPLAGAFRSAHPPAPARCRPGW